MNIQTKRFSLGKNNTSKAARNKRKTLKHFDFVFLKAQFLVTLDS